jgi:hypothetical protein
VRATSERRSRLGAREIFEATGVRGLHSEEEIREAVERKRKRQRNWPQPKTPEQRAREALASLLNQRNPHPLIKEAMDATVGPPRRTLKLKTVPPERRRGSCFDGWDQDEIVEFVRYLVERIGEKETASLLRVSTATARKYARR